MDALQPCVYETPFGERLQYRFHAPVAQPGKAYPLLLLLHGAGERGDDNQKQLIHGAGPIMDHAAQRGIEFFFVVPQCPAGLQWVNASWSATAHTMPEFPSTPMRLAIELLQRLIGDLPVDRDRVYVTGISMGGYVAWDLIQRKAELFAAAVPVCGGGDVAMAPRLTKLPIWAFHGDRDTVVPTVRSRAMVDAVRAHGGTIQYREYPGVEHNSWTPTYADPQVLDWIFSQKRKP